MHYDYWEDKVSRFETEEIKESWVRRQLTDTQMVSKYAREFLKTYFKKVTVQKGSTTAEFRKIFKFQSEDEIKSRDKHTHHSIDAAVLTLIPTNSSKRVEILNKLYKSQEEKKPTYHTTPDGFTEFNAQELIDYINNNTLIVNYKKDKITEQTYRNVRKRGKIQYLKKNGKYVLDKGGNKIPLKAKGTTIRGKLFQETFIGKIKNVERDEDNKPLRNKDGSWKYLSGKDEFSNIVRKPITEAKVEDIVDPDIKKNIEKQLKEGKSISELKDHQGNIIRHIRVKTKAGKVLKERLNYKSKHDYKNKYYAAAGEIPYAIFITNLISGRLERKMIPVAIHEVAQVFKDKHKFNIDYYLEKFYPEITEKQDVKLLKVGQKVFVLNDDSEFEKRKEIDFQIKRMYKIIKLDNAIWLKYHLEAQKDTDIDEKLKLVKDNIVRKIEIDFNIPEVKEDANIENPKQRKDKYKKDRFSFSNYSDFRLDRLISIIGKEEVVKLRLKLRKIKTISSEIDKDIIIPLLKINKSERWNFLFENYDFKIDLTGETTWLSENK